MPFGPPGPLTPMHHPGDVEIILKGDDAREYLYLHTALHDLANRAKCIAVKLTADVNALNEIAGIPDHHHGPHHGHSGSPGSRR